MKMPSLTLRQWVGYTGFALVFIVVAAVVVWRGDILKAGLDPQIPFQTYEPPPAPDYRRACSLGLARRAGARRGKRRDLLHPFDHLRRRRRSGTARSAIARPTPI